MTDPTERSGHAAIRRGSRSFALAARLFDRRTAADAAMLYAWCRHCDDAIDGQNFGRPGALGVHDPRARLRELVESTRAALCHGKHPIPAFDGLARVALRHDIPERQPTELLTGFAMDMAGRRYRTIEDTLDYCYHVAGAVGVMMAMVMGARERAALDRASDLGIAFQLTNIARDVIEDARIGRVYVPAAWLADCGLGAVDPDDLDQRPRLHAAALRLLDLAQAYYASAQCGLGALPQRAAWAVASAARIYRGIGDVVRRGGPEVWHGRPVVSGAGKAAAVAIAALDAARSRTAPAGHVRAGLWDRPGASDDYSVSSVAAAR